MEAGSDARKFGHSWVALCVAVAVHVADEALTDFLSVYNPTVLTIRERYPWFPMPVFEFQTWLAGLMTGIVLLLALSPFAYRGARWMVPLAYVFGTIMLLNGLGHIAGSFYLGRLMPGVYSSPLLLVTSIYLLYRAGGGHRTVR